MLYTLSRGFYLVPRVVDSVYLIARTYENDEREKEESWGE